MARYTCTYNVGLSVKDMLDSIKEILEGCSFNLCYETGGYVMAKEQPGTVTFTQLVEVEILFDRNKAAHDSVQVDFVVKNEELPLQTDNHCHQIFQAIQQAIAQCENWQLEADVPG